MLSSSLVFLSTLCLSAYAGPAAAPAGQPVQFEIGGIFCLTAAGNFDGAAVTIAQCSLDQANRTWTVTNGGSTTGQGPASPIVAFGNKCLDVTNGANSDGTKLQLWTCAKGNTNQMWNVDSDGTIHWAGTNKCVDNTGGVTKNANPAQVWTCSNNGNPNQIWTSQPISGGPPIAPGGTVTFRVDEPAIHENGCLTASNNTDGASVVVDVCRDGTPGQEWTVQKGSANSGKGPAGTLTVFGNKCLDVPSGNTTPGTKLQIFTCFNGNTNQLWQVNGDLTISWSGENRCVDLTNGNVTDGSQIQSWTCVQFNQNQQWGWISVEA